MTAAGRPLTVADRLNAELLEIQDLLGLVSAIGEQYTGELDTVDLRAIVAGAGAVARVVQAKAEAVKECAETLIGGPR